MPPVLAPYTFYTGCRRVCGNVVQGFYSFNYKYEINTNLMVLYFADTTARSKFACNFSSSFSFFFFCALFDQELEMLQRVVGPYSSNNCDANENVAEK